MRETGIIRRVDMLGRVVIPKEMRTILKIDFGDPLEIFADKDGIILKKHYPLAHLGSASKGACETLFKFTGHESAICDENVFVAAAGKNAEKYSGKEISGSVSDLIKENKKYLTTFSGGGETLPLSGEEKDFFNQFFAPITVDGKAIGMIALLSDKPDRQISEQDAELCMLVSELIASAAQ